MRLIVYHKSNGLIADEFLYSDDIQITDHIKKFVGDTKDKDCFLFKFPSGNYCFYANSDYYYKIKEGVRMTQEEIKSIAETECKKLLKSEKGYNGISFQEFWADGLKWGMENATQWHEIKCCSQDLPPRSKDNYLHSVIVSNEYGEPIYYDYNIDEWCDMEGDVVSEGYKHWCELPQFKDKE